MILKVRQMNSLANTQKETKEYNTEGKSMTIPQKDTKEFTDNTQNRK